MSPSTQRSSHTFTTRSGSFFLALHFVCALAAVIAGCPAFANPPAHPGNSGVFRFADFVGFFMTDPEGELTSFHSFSTRIADVCAGTDPVVDLLSIQMIESPSGAVHALFKQSEHYVQIYPASPPGCANWQGLPLLYSGTVKLLRTDNDIVVGGPGANAFGWQAIGQLTDHQHGGIVNYREIVRLVIPPHADPNDPNSVRELVVDIDVH
jgi:hypothetical protein